MPGRQGDKVPNLARVYTCRNATRAVAGSRSNLVLEERVGRRGRDGDAGPWRGHAVVGKSPVVKRRQNRVLFGHIRTEAQVVRGFAQDAVGWSRGALEPAVGVTRCQPCAGPRVARDDAAGYKIYVVVDTAVVDRIQSQQRGVGVGVGWMPDVNTSQARIVCFGRGQCLSNVPRFVALEGYLMNKIHIMSCTRLSYSQTSPKDIGITAPVSDAKVRGRLLQIAAA